MTQHTLHVLQLNFQESEIRKQESVVKKGFKSEEGPFANSLDKILFSFNVERQAYYGGTFVGNHVHRSLKVYMYTNPYCYDKFLHVLFVYVGYSQTTSKLCIVPHLKLLGHDNKSYCLKLRK